MCGFGSTAGPGPFHAWLHILSHSRKLGGVQEFHITNTEMNEDSVRDLLQRVKEETKSELRAEFAVQQEKTRQEISEQLARQQEKIDAFTSLYVKLADPRLSYFNTDEKSSVGSKAIADQAIYQRRKNAKQTALLHGCCMGCGTTACITCAHIVGNTGNMADYTCWGTSSTIANYTSDIDPYSSANLLVLCGTKGNPGTCHDAYDKHIISLYYDEAQGDYVWWVRLPDFRNPYGIDIHGQHIAIADPKYRRLLAWRTLAAVAVVGPSRGQSPTEKIEFVDMLLKSEAEEQM